MRVLVGLLLVLVPASSLCFEGTVLQTDWSTIVQPLEKQVPRIEVLYRGDTFVCSGVVINADAGFVLTAGHCVDGKPEEMSVTVNGRHAEVARVNRLLDLAVLRFNARSEKSLPLAEDSPHAGAEIAIAGYMLGQKQFHVQFGRIAARRSDNGALVLDGVALPGDSGGAVINAKGELVGMTNQMYPGTAVGLAVPIEIVKDFAEQYVPKAKK